MKFLKKITFSCYGTTTIYGGGAQIQTNITDIDTLEGEPSVEIDTTNTVGSPNTLLGTETRKVIVGANVGEMNGHVLPAAVINLAFTFICNNANGVRVKAAASDTIRVDASITITEGYIESTVVGSAVELVCIDGTEWIATSIVGTWVVETS